MDELIDPLNTNNNFSPKSLPNSTAVLVLGIVSIVGCFFCGYSWNYLWDYCDCFA